MYFRKAEAVKGTIAYKKGNTIHNRHVDALRFPGSLGFKK
jgi:hypothetical protein